MIPSDRCGTGRAGATSRAASFATATRVLAAYDLLIIG
jgi:hypothetical protein